MHLEEHHTEGPQVRAWHSLTVGEHLGRDVEWRSHEGLFRSLHVRSAKRKLARLPQNFGRVGIWLEVIDIVSEFCGVSKINQFQVHPFVKHNVFRFQISVHQLHPMQLLER